MMQRFPGIYWFCTRCHAFLNRQAGFDDRLPRWLCARCGHENTIGKDQLYLLFGAAGSVPECRQGQEGLMHAGIIGLHPIPRSGGFRGAKKRLLHLFEENF